MYRSSRFILFLYSYSKITPSPQETEMPNTGAYYTHGHYPHSSTIHKSTRHAQHYDGAPEALVSRPQKTSSSSKKSTSGVVSIYTHLCHQRELSADRDASRFHRRPSKSYTPVMYRTTRRPHRHAPSLLKTSAASLLIHLFIMYIAWNRILPMDILRRRGLQGRRH